MFDLYKQIKKEYPPLQSLEEERRLITVERHNEDRCRELLVLHNIGLAQSMAAQFMRICGGYADAVQIAMIGLIRAAEKFDLDRNFKFTTYAAYKIMGKLSNQLVNKANITNNLLSMSMNRPVYARKSKTPDSDSAELADFIDKVIEPRYKEQTKFEFNPQKEAEKSDSIRYIEKIINGLKCEPRAKNIVKEYIGITESAEFEGIVTLELLSVKYGVSRERIRQILGDTYELIKRKLIKVPDYKLAIAGRSKKESRYAKNNVRWSKPTSESVRYKRIEKEGIKDVRFGNSKKKNLKHHMVISGFSNFYSDRYQEMMREITKKAEIARKVNSSIACTLTLQAALQRRKAQYQKADSVVHGPSTTVPDSTYSSNPQMLLEVENPQDVASEEMLKNADQLIEEDFRKVEEIIVEQEEVGAKNYGIGSFEDDGDMDYEVESA